MNRGSAPNHGNYVREIVALFPDWSASVHPLTKRSGSGMLRFDRGPDYAEVVVDESTILRCYLRDKQDNEYYPETWDELVEVVEGAF